MKSDNVFRREYLGEWTQTEPGMFERGKKLSDIPDHSARMLLLPWEDKDVGAWQVLFNPRQKLGGVLWSELRGFIDEAEAAMVVAAINAYQRGLPASKERERKDVVINPDDHLPDWNS